MGERYPAGADRRLEWSKSGAAEGPRRIPEVEGGSEGVSRSTDAWDKGDRSSDVEGAAQCRGVVRGAHGKAVEGGRAGSSVFRHCQCGHSSADWVAGLCLCAEEYHSAIPAGCGGLDNRSKIMEVRPIRRGSISGGAGASGWRA